METIDADLPCVTCGYNLRTLPGDGVCPECAKNIAASVEANRLRVTPFARLRDRGLPWLERAKSAVTLALIANVGSIVFGVLFRPIHAPFLGNGAWIGAAWLTPLTAIFVMSCWAAWKLADFLGPSMATVARVTSAVTLVSLGMIFLNPRWLAFYFDLNWWTADNIDAQVLGPTRFVGLLFLLAWPISMALTMFAASKLFWVARHRLFAIAAACVSSAFAAFIGFAIVANLFDSYGLSRAGSGEMMPWMLGPTGSIPMLGAIVHDLRLRRVEDLIATGLFLAATFVVAWPIHLRSLLSRAIRLGELPAASSRSSPSPRPPG